MTMRREEHSPSHRAKLAALDHHGSARICLARATFTKFRVRSGAETREGAAILAHAGLDQGGPSRYPRPQFLI